MSNSQNSAPTGLSDNSDRILQLNNDHLASIMERRQERAAEDRSSFMSIGAPHNSRLGLAHDYNAGGALWSMLYLAEARDELRQAMATFDEYPNTAGPIVAVEDVSKAINTEDDGTLECSICYDGDKTQMVATIACNHGFCKECLNAWMQSGQLNSHTCPFCRTELISHKKEEEEEEEEEEEKEDGWEDVENEDEDEDEDEDEEEHEGEEEQDDYENDEQEEEENNHDQEEEESYNEQAQRDYSPFLEPFYPTRYTDYYTDYMMEFLGRTY